MIPTQRKKHLLATYAALYAVGKAIPGEGVTVVGFAGALAGRLPVATIRGLMLSLCKMKVADVSGLNLSRGPEWKDGLERIRLASEEIKAGREPLIPLL